MTVKGPLELLTSLAFVSRPEPTADRRSGSLRIPFILCHAPETASSTHNYVSYNCESHEYADPTQPGIAQVAAVLGMPHSG
jgi:hypothetical protein